MSEFQLPLIQPTDSAPKREGRKAIEAGFPFLEISKLARIEAYRKNIYRPAYYIHKWWARRTGSVFRAIMLGCLKNENENIFESFYSSQPDLGRGTLVLDPFMGGGTTIGEALRLGAKVIGIDINPVAWFLVKKVVEPVSLDELDKAYQFIETSIGNRILQLYSTTCSQCAGEATAIYTYWVKVIACRNCGTEVPLRKSMILARHMSQPNTGLVTCPQCGHLSVSQRLDASIICSKCSEEYQPSHGYSSGAKYQCPTCLCVDRILEACGNSGLPPQHRMIGIAYSCSRCGKGYKQPDQRDLLRWEEISSRFDQEKNDLRIPQEPIPSGYNTDQMRNYNYRFWYQMFNERQLLGISMLLSAISQIEKESIREFMLLLLSGVLEFNNLFCSPKGLGTGAVRHLFAHHAFIPPKEVIEANLWGVSRSSGGFSILYRERLRRGKQWAYSPVEHKITSNGMAKIPTPGESVKSPLASSYEELTQSPSTNVWLLNRSSTRLPELPTKAIDVIVTDPPYLDNVMYSELADFFYVWLQLALQERYREFIGPSVNKNEEAIKNLNNDPNAQSYQAILTMVFSECERVLKDDGLLVFTFHHGSAEAWEALGYALKNAGFIVQQHYPVYAEMDVGVPVLGKESVKFDAILVCRKREKTINKVGRQDDEVVLNEIRKTTYLLITQLEKEFSMSEKDKRSIAQATWLMLYTQGKTDSLASQIEWERVFRDA